MCSNLSVFRHCQILVFHTVRNIVYGKFSENLNSTIKILEYKWLICNFMSFSAVFQSYQENKRVTKSVCKILLTSKSRRQFVFFSTVLQSYQDNVRVIMKACVQWNPV